MNQWKFKESGLSREQEFQTKAIETIHGLTRKQNMTQGVTQAEKYVPNTFFAIGKSNQDTELCSKSHGIW